MGAEGCVHGRWCKMPTLPIPLKRISGACCNASPGAAVLSLRCTAQITPVRAQNGHPLLAGKPDRSRKNGVTSLGPKLPMNTRIRRLFRIPPSPDSYDASRWGSSKMGTGSRWHHERAPHLSQFGAHHLHPQPSRWITHPLTHAWMIPSSKRKQIRTRGSTNGHTHSAFVATPRPREASVSQQGRAHDPCTHRPQGSKLPLGRHQKSSRGSSTLRKTRRSRVSTRGLALKIGNTPCCARVSEWSSEIGLMRQHPPVGCLSNDLRPGVAFTCSTATSVCPLSHVIKSFPVHVQS